MEIIEAGRGNHFDPKILDAFATVPRDLYDRYVGHDSDNLQEELVATVEKYFSAGMDTLSYGKI